MNDELEFDTYSFYYTSSEGREVDLTFHPEWDATWTHVLENFLDFLGGIYGYDLRDQVAVKFKPHRSQSDWSGPVFDETVQERQKKWEQLELFDPEKHNFGGTD